MSLNYLPNMFVHIYSFIILNIFKVSSQEANNTKHSQSSNKRIKKDNVHGETIESLESNTPPSLGKCLTLIKSVNLK